MHQVRWTAPKIARRIALIEPLAYRRRQPLPSFRYSELTGPEVPPPIGPEVSDADWAVIAPHTYWGRWQTDFVLRGSFQVPAEWDPDLPVALLLLLGESTDFSHPEALVYLDGLPYAACDRHHQEILLPARWRDGQVHRLALHGWTGLGGFYPGTPPTQLFMGPCAVVQIDPPIRSFLAAARVALGAAEALAADDPVRDRLLNALDEAFRTLDTGEPLGEAFYASVPAAEAVLRAGVESAGRPQGVEIVAAGHAHIDLAWLWTIGQTRHKARRTFHTVLRLMEQFPEYHFTQRQPQLYAYVQEDDPALFAAIRQRVHEGRWEPIGGMWVEADCNLSGAEALARQFLLGRRSFREQFGSGVESPVLWLPDVFGYPWSLPQLIRQAGLRAFFTTKMGWNQYNRLPYDTFWWQGLDGTRVLTHFNTTPGSFGSGTYNAVVSPEEVLGTWRGFQQKELEQPLTLVFGYGDGGGGPTREMLENLREMAGFPGLPRVRPGRMGAFFEQVEERVGERLPTWNGELYLELHRGTYTSQGRTKRANRRCEFLLHDAEFLAAMASLLEAAYRYPGENLRRAWELLCRQQFHDILPGSSIGEVYAEAAQAYRQVEGIGVDVCQEALAVLGRHLGGHLLLVNPTSFARQDVAFWSGSLLPGQWLRRPDGTRAPVQPTEGGIWIAAGELPPYSVTPLELVQGDLPPVELPAAAAASPAGLENAFLRVELDRAGEIVRLYDKANRREVLPAGELANQFQAFEDRPLAWDAWDVESYFEDRCWGAEPAHSIEVVEAGPLRASVKVCRRLRQSEIVQQISLSHDSPRLDFDTAIDWHERHILLKAAFPVDVLSPTATYEIQWGNLERPTHRNTSWDWARFEAVAHKWVDLSEGGYGVSLLNDGKYGHDVRDKVLRISLLRGPTAPDPQADQGRHAFVYSLFPHAGRWGQDTVREAYALNDALIAAPGPGGEAIRDSLPPLAAVDAPNVVVETIKRAEDGVGIVVRLYECQRRRGLVELTAAFPLAAAWRTNLLEEDGEEIPSAGHRVRFEIKPYEIVTLRLVPEAR